MLRVAKKPVMVTNLGSLIQALIQTHCPARRLHVQRSQLYMYITFLYLIFDLCHL